MSQNKELSFSVSFSEKSLNENEELENLFVKFFQETDNHEKSKIVHLLVQAYLHYFKNDLDNNVKSAEFLQLLSQVPLLCKKFLQISEFSCNHETVNKSMNLESASLCFHALLLCLEAFYMTSHCVILVKIVLNILFQGYTHCKESEIIYGDMLEQFADQLGAFFKKIEKLQTIVLQYLEKLDVTEYAEDDIQVNSIVVELGNLCQIVFTLDADVAFQMWTKYLRIITDYKSLKPVSNINEISSCLSSKNADILLDIKQSLEANSDVDEELAAKLFFYLNALSDFINLAKDCDIDNKLSLVSVLLDCVVLCYSPFIIEKTSLNIVKKSLEKNVFTLMTHFCTDEEFLKTLLFHPQDADSFLSTILTKLCALQCIGSISLESREAFLKQILSDILSDDDDYNMKLLYILIPQQLLTKAKSDQLVTLYQLAYEIVAESLKLMPDSFIEKLESTIFKSLVSSSDVICILISDVWIYRLRCSTIEFLNERCYSVLQSLHKENINNSKMENLAKRMLRFLPQSDKDKLLEAFCSLKFVHESKWIQHRYGIPDHTSTESEIKISSEEKIKMMMYQLNESPSNDAVTLIKRACTCLELCTCFVPIAECSEIFQFLELASELFKTGIYEIQIVVLSLLKCLSNKTMPEHSQEFGKVVAVLVQLFSDTMHSKNYIVRYEARNIFSYFAKSTKHLKIVQETVKKDPTLKHILKSYLNTVPEHNFLSDKEKANYLHKQCFMPKNMKFQIPPDAIESLQQLFSRANWRSLI